jgi:antitoxin component of RelBE/YafQ-DinJ toxin-antitoxin module
MICLWQDRRCSYGKDIKYIHSCRAETQRTGGACFRAVWYFDVKRIGLFLIQVVLQRGIPFELKLPKSQPLSVSMLTEEQFNAAIEKGLDNLIDGKVVSAESVAERMRQDYGI